jgi:hypothetical protein
VDADKDGHGAAPCGDDCDDVDPSVHPGAPEVCNGRDDNCDGYIDEVRVLSEEIVLSESATYNGQIGRLTRPVLFQDGPSTWFVSWPDVDCSGSSSGASFAYQQLALEGSPIPGRDRQWFGRDGYSNWGEWPSAVPVAGGYLAAAAVQVGSPLAGWAEIAEIPATGPASVSMLPLAPANRMGPSTLAVNGNDVLLIYPQATWYSLPLDVHGSPTGAASDLGPGWDVGSGLTWDAGSSAFVFLMVRQLAVGEPVHALFLNADGSIRDDRVLPLYSAGMITDAWLLWHGSGYLAAWSDVVGGTDVSHYAMALSPSFEPSPAQLFATGYGEIWGVAQRGDEIGIAWSSSAHPTTLTLVGRDARRRAPDLTLMPFGEGEDRGEVSRLAASPSAFGVIELLADRSPPGACAAEPLDQHTRVAMRILSCP